MDQVTVLIPVWKPGEQFGTLLKRLSLQTVRPKRVLIMNTVEGDEDDQLSALVDTFQDRFEVLSVFHVEKKDFDHGGTRDMAARMARGELLIFMTM